MECDKQLIYVIQNFLQMHLWREKEEKQEMQEFGD